LLFFSPLADRTNEFISSSVSNPSSFDFLSAAPVVSRPNLKFLLSTYYSQTGICHLSQFPITVLCYANLFDISPFAFISSSLF
jgi:hypothetical protein